MSELGRTEGRHLGVCAVRAPCSWEEGSDSQWAVIVRICSLWLLQPSSSPGPASDPRNLPSQFWRPEVWGSGVQGTVPTQAPGYGPPSLLQLLESWKVHGGPELSHPSSLCVCAGMSLLCARFGFTPTPTRLHSLALGVRQVSQCRLVLGFSRFLRVSTLLVLADYAPSYLPASVASALCQQPRLCGFWAQALTWSLVCTTLFPSWLPGPGDPALAGASDPGPGGGVVTLLSAGLRDFWVHAAGRGLLGVPQERLSTQTPAAPRRGAVAPFPASAVFLSDSPKYLCWAALIFCLAEGVNCCHWDGSLSLRGSSDPKGLLHFDPHPAGRAGGKLARLWKQVLGTLTLQTPATGGVGRRQEGLGELVASRVFSPWGLALASIHFLFGAGLFALDLSDPFMGQALTSNEEVHQMSPLPQLPWPQRTSQQAEVVLLGSLVLAVPHPPTRDRASTLSGSSPVGCRNCSLLPLPPHGPHTLLLGWRSFSNDEW